MYVFHHTNEFLFLPQFELPQMVSSLLDLDYAFLLEIPQGCYVFLSISYRLRQNVSVPQYR